MLRKYFSIYWKFISLKLYEEMKKSEYIFVAIIAIGTIIFLCFTPKHGTVVYDCSLAEISPDYPIDVKEGCRKLRAEKIKEDLQKSK